MELGDFVLTIGGLNAITLKENFPMPDIDDLMDELEGSSWFSKLDLRAG
jgi:hypothetical protein